MSTDTILQMQLLQSGMLWHLIKSLFTYDFTLEECGVEATEESNQQILINNFSKMSVVALKCMSGDGVNTPMNDVIRASLDALLLPYGAKMVLLSILCVIDVDIVSDIVLLVLSIDPRKRTNFCFKSVE